MMQHQNRDLPTGCQLLQSCQGKVVLLVSVRIRANRCSELDEHIKDHEPRIGMLFTPPVNFLHTPLISTRPCSCVMEPPGHSSPKAGKSLSIRRCSRRLPSSKAKYKTAPCSHFLLPRQYPPLALARATSSAHHDFPTFGLPASSSNPSTTRSGTRYLSGGKIIRRRSFAVSVMAPLLVLVGLPRRLKVA